MDRLLEYVGHHPLLVGAAVIAAALALAYEYFLKAQDANAVSPQQLIQLMNQGALVLDVRGLDDYAAGHISGAKQLPPELLAKAAETFKRHRERAVIVYGDNDSAGPAAARKLAAQGFTKALCLKGGLPRWRAENLPLTK